ncbi:glycoside hydrolase family 28 protein [Serendipita vermifera MAFF 305830]|uniref:galacturonan 1,4-alpha-galacturonidase n=1 Tax=Serendipita vermifera MAFF 305830 TaxID=933852 RepID=A0A0C3BAS3_SERVB|nr:glycoside hydrolase family 28 protein [Serendipita vermifera MAFF 305830]
MRSHLLFLASVLFNEAVVQATNNNCIVPHTPNADDSPAIMEVFGRCSVNKTIVFSAGVAYNAWTPMRWTGLSNVNINVKGSLHLPNNITDVQAKVVTAYGTVTPAPWFYIQGTNVHLTGSESDGAGALHGYGQQWWDGMVQKSRPTMVQFNVSHGTISKMKVIKPVAQGFNIPGNNIIIKNHFVDAMPTNGSRDLTASFPFNTDGFNIGGQNITIDGYYGHNGDDCVSIVNKAKNVVAKNGYCGFSSHGLSIGSLGKDGANSQVADIVFDNWVMDNAVYGARFKSWTGGKGLARNITWKNMKLVNVSTPIFITQNYYDQNKGPRPNNTEGTSTKVQDFHFENFKGDINPNYTDGTCISNPCWNWVDGINGTQGIIFDLYEGTATGLQVKNFHVHPYQQGYEKTTVICDPATLAAGEQDTLGFKCQNGPFVETSIAS